MVLAAKIFLVNAETNLNEIARKLMDYRVEETSEENTPLITEIIDLDLAGNRLRGVYVKDNIIYINRRGEKIPITITSESPIIFTKFKDRILLTVMAKKNSANYIANEISKILFISIGAITEAKISPETLRRYHEENPRETKIIFFDNVDIPNINKLSLYGEDLKTSSLYTEYLSHGDIWYIVATSRRYGYIVGITRNCVLTSFSKISEYDLSLIHI